MSQYACLKKKLKRTEKTFIEPKENNKQRPYKTIYAFPSTTKQYVLYNS